MNELFPHSSYRSEQYAIISALKNNAQKIVLIDAETGSGKTAAVLATILSKKHSTERLIIYTKMLGQMDAWIKEIGLINDLNIQLGRENYALIPIIGKKHLCPLVTQETQNPFSQIGCSLFNCEIHKAFYASLSDFEDKKTLSLQILTNLASYIKKGVGLSELLWILENKIEKTGCSYLTLKTILKHANIIIATYPFLLNTFLRERLFSSMALNLSSTSIIIDEAHNLAKGIADELSYKLIDRAIEEIGHHTILDELILMKEKDGLQTIHIDEELFADLLARGKQNLLWRYKQGYQGVSSTLRVCEFIKNSIDCFLAADKKFTLYLKDPRKVLEPIKNANQLILLSGTFQPIDYFANFLGVPNAQKITVVPENSRKNRIVLTSSDPSISMRFEVRNKDTFIKYSNFIQKLIPIIPAHTLIFTPNYEITTILANLLNADYYEHPNQDISKLITAVRTSKKKLTIIAPARGKISEGIEFVVKDQSIISAVIIAGLPYPPPTKSLKMIINEYSKFWGEEKAIEFMSFLPAAVTLRQCLGRMLRSENDFGAWIVLDNRVNNTNILPKAIECKTTEKMVEYLTWFYKYHMPP